MENLKELFGQPNMISHTRDSVSLFGYFKLQHLTQSLESLSSLANINIGVGGGRGSPWWLRKYRICLRCKRPCFDTWVGKIPWRRDWLPTSEFLPRESCGQKSLADYNP